MAETENKVEALEKEAVAEASANPQADAPKKNAVAAEPSHIASMNNAEDLGAAVVKPTDSNPDATKKVKQVSGDAQQKSQGAPDAMPKLSGHNTKLESTETEEEGSEEIKEGEMPKAALDALKKHQKKDEEKSEDEEKKEGYGMKTAEKEKEAKPMMKASYKKEDIDVSEHVDALVSGESDLSEEFKTKAATVFEAAIKSKIGEIAETMEADYNNKLEQESAKAKEELTEKVDSYLSYVVEEWMKENEIALERGIKGEIAEDFISGLKKLFSEHYIDVPDEKYDILEGQAQKIEELESKLNETIDKMTEMNKEKSTLVREQVIAKVSTDLAETEKEKFEGLVEDVEFADEESFTAKLNTLKESYFPKTVATKTLEEEVETDKQEVDVSGAMAAYMSAITKSKPHGAEAFNIVKK